MFIARRTEKVDGESWGILFMVSGRGGIYGNEVGWCFSSSKTTRGSSSLQGTGTTLTKLNL